jgi:multidrug efflux pump subunit AcrA (membrane-fusion protein)
LPAKYQTPMVLCYLEGRTHEQAALELGWAKGTVAGRLSRARDLLRRRLTRRGLVLSGGLAFVAVPSIGSAAVPAVLAQNTCKAALAFAAGKMTGLSPQVALWAEGAVRNMLLTKIKSAIIILAALAFVGGGTGTILYGVAGTDGAKDGDTPALPSKDEPKPATAAEPAAKKRSPNIFLVSPREGIVLLVASDVNKGEKVPPERMVEYKVDGKTRSFKSLHEGDTVKAGQLLMKLDDRLARNELRIAKAKLAFAQAEHRGAHATLLEANARFETATRLWNKNPPAIAEEDYREKKLARDKFEPEIEGKKAQIAVAEIQVVNAEIIVEMHEVRSPVNGVIRTILKRAGEGVKALDPVIEILPQGKTR